MLRLAGITEVISCRPAPGEIVQPRQLPDGLLEVRIGGMNEPVWFIIEIATYPERRVSDQVLRDALLVLLDRRAVPEVVTLVLHPKGTYRVPGTQSLASPLNGTRLDIAWRVIELWTLTSDQLLAANDVGLIPWVVLTQFSKPPEVVFQQCRDRIDQLAPPELHDNLLAVTQVLMGLRYNDPKFFAIFGGKKVMIESPVIQELLAKTKQDVIVEVLEARFGTLPSDLTASLRAIQDGQRLGELARLAGICPDLQAFSARISS